MIYRENITAMPCWVTYHTNKGLAVTIMGDCSVVYRAGNHTHSDVLIGITKQVFYDGSDV